MKVMRFIVCLLFGPLTIWYGAVVAVRNWLYDRKLRKTYIPPVPTLCVGNLCIGGSGKTPHTEYLLRRLTQGHSLEEWGITTPADGPVALLSRGYGRSTKGFVLADANHCSAADLGDEPAMMARKFPQVITAVCEQRAEGIRRLMALAEPPALIVLDDAYQHRAVQASHNILLTEYQRPYFRDFILPFGNLREGRRGRRRADTVIVTKCPFPLSETDRKKFSRHLKLDASQQLLFTTVNYRHPRTLFDHREASLKGYDEILLFTGIAHPQPLQEHLARHHRLTTLRFPDHHHYSASDIATIVRRFIQMPHGRAAIVTTEKDAARLWDNPAAEQLKKLPLFYLEIDVTPL